MASPTDTISRKRVALVVLSILGGAAWLFRAPAVQWMSAPPVVMALKAASAPASDAAWTSTRQIMALTLAPDGTLWAATSGGVLRCDTSGQWHKWTRSEGLHSSEVRRVSLSQAGVLLETPLGNAGWNGSTWIPRPTPTPPKVRLVAASTSKIEAAQIEPIEVQWRGQTCTASLDGLKIGTREVGLPPSNGTHLSALLPTKNALWAAMFGDGLWSYDGKWRRVSLQLPPRAVEITALTGTPKSLWLGTRREGVWHFDGREWTQFLQPDEPFDHNAQSLAMFGGVLWMSTLEDGLQARTARGWQHFAAPQISSDAPRQMLEFQGALYVRHGGGQVDKWDGAKWARDVFAQVPRHKVFAIATDGETLFLGQWGGWSEWNGARWQHFLTIPNLQGLPLMALHADENSVWVGTQSRGVAQWNHAQKSLRWHDERQGLSDDWITTLAQSGDTIAAGTFVGGLNLYDGKTWRAESQLAGENVTDLTSDGAGGFLIATRHGVWQRDKTGTMRKLKPQLVDAEAQALCRVPEGVWVGARTGLCFLRS